MKKNLIVLLMLLSGLVTNAQLNVTRITGEIIEKITPALSLNTDQKPQVEEAIAEFLTKKIDILPVEKTDAPAYASKFNQLNGAFISKLKSILVAKQMTSFLGLKPKINNPANVLSHLFY